MKKENLKIRELDPKIEIFGAFNFDTLTSWSQIVLWCAINGFEADYDVFKFFMFGAAMYDDVYQMLLNTIKNTDILDSFINNANTLDLLYKYSDAKIVMESDMALDWIKLRSLKTDNATVYSACDTVYDMNEWPMTKRRYKLFSAIDNKFPLLQLEFYRRHSKALQMFDQEFVRYLLERTRIKAKYNSLFVDAYNTISKDKLNQLATNTFLS